MSKYPFLFIFFLLITTGSVAQNSPDTIALSQLDSANHLDSIRKTDSLKAIPVNYSISSRPIIDSTWNAKEVVLSTSAFSWQVLKRNPYFDFKTKPFVKPGASLKIFFGKEFIFYLIIFLLLVFGVFRQLFPKYFNDLFSVFFRTTLKQSQIREQLMQTPLPSLMLNGFFVVSAALYITFLLEYYKSNPVDQFWLLFFYCVLGLSIIYMVKFLGLKIAGWIFDLKESTDAYIFIVYITNKMIGILLLPLLILLAFSDGKIFSVSITISWCLLASLYLYRIILTYSVIRNQIKVHPFHFLLYFCAFEIAPLLLVYRGLLLFFNVTT